MQGQTLGPYEILDLLGKGGMGEVYRARDTRLGREVAIKVLPREIADDAEVRARFEREATTISSLSHPHICVLHDVGHEGDTFYLVMELVEGMTLEQKLREKALTLDEVFGYGAQIADALDRAHRAGVIHRDLKPGNVMITRTGAKLMDFGLARSAAIGGDSDLTVAASPTVAHPLTREGAIVGTFQYMAPEQLEGREADARSDLWALGCVLYEMATGECAFAGATQASLIGSILHHHPEPVSQRIALAPVEFDRLVNACLLKDPDERLQSAHDAKLQLSWLRDGPPSTVSAVAPTSMATGPKRRSGARRSLVMVALLAAVLGAAATWMLVGGDESTEGFVDRPARTRLGQWEMRPSSAPVITPDGRAVVFALREGVSSIIARRDFDRFEITTIQGTEGGTSPFFSPDGRWLGFVTDDAVHKVPVGGGVSQVIAAVAGINSADWSEDGWIYLSPSLGGLEDDSLLLRVREDGGAVEQFGKLDREAGETGSWLPEVLPGGETVLVTTVGPRSRIVAQHVDGSREVVVQNAFLARYVEPGHLLYRDMASQATAVVPFDADTATVTGGPVVLTERTDASYCHDVSVEGVLVYVPSTPEGQGSHLIWVDPEGARTVAADVRGTWRQPRISPDGSRVLVRRTGSSCELWVLDRERNSFSRIVQGDDAHDPLWAPDGRRILYDRANTGEIVVMDVIGSRSTRVVASGPRRGTPGSWSTGSGLYASTVTGQGGQTDIWVQRIDDPDSAPEPFVGTPQSERDPAISPDGSWIAYVSTETGIPEVFVRPYPDDGRAWQVSAGGGESPLWSRDGGRLFFTALEQDALLAVDVETGADAGFGPPSAHLSGVIDRVETGNYDVAPDGSFVTVGTKDGSSSTEIRLLTHWQKLEAELRGAPR